MRLVVQVMLSMSLLSCMPEPPPALDGSTGASGLATTDAMVDEKIAVTSYLSTPASGGHEVTSDRATRVDPSSKERPPRVIAGRAEVRELYLNRKLIRVFMIQHRREVNACYWNEPSSQTGLSGRVVVRFSISPEGRVHGASVESSTLGSPRIEQCIIQIVRGWVFPRAPGAGEIVLSYPFVFLSLTTGAGREVRDRRAHQHAPPGPGRSPVDRASYEGQGSDRSGTNARVRPQVDDAPGISQAAREEGERPLHNWGLPMVSAVLVGGLGLLALILIRRAR